MEAWSKRLKKEQGKGYKSNAAEVLTDDEFNILYKKNIYTTFLKIRQSAGTQREQKREFNLTIVLPNEGWKFGWRWKSQ